MLEKQKLIYFLESLEPVLQVPGEHFDVPPRHDVLHDRLRDLQFLHRRPKPAGEHEVRWDARGLASGIYFYRIKAGSFAAVKKTLLLR